MTWQDWGDRVSATIERAAAEIREEEAREARRAAGEPMTPDDLAHVVANVKQRAGWATS